MRLVTVDLHPADDTGASGRGDLGALAADDLRAVDSRIPAVLFGVIALLMAADLLEDSRAGTGWGHLAGELAVLAVALAGLVVLFQRYTHARREHRLLRRDLAKAREDAARWREEAHTALAGLGEALDGQFERWGLTAAEREVGLLLLKGLGFKEIAQVRGTSERTVRQQALVLYRKAGLSGRAELAAFFLEDLLLPVAGKPRSTT